MNNQTFYFCTDMARVLEWWRQPLTSVIWSLTDWHPEDDTPHPVLIDEAAVRETLLLQLRALRDEYGAGPTLGQLTEMTVEDALDSHGTAQGVRQRSAPRSVALDRLVSLCRLYADLAQAARRGPFNDPLDMRMTDTLFARWLTRFLPENLAEQYDGSLPSNRRPFAPPALAGLNQDLRLLAESRLNTYQMDAARWARSWQQLDRIPAFWDRLGRELDERLVAYVQGVGVIAGFADEFGLAMLKVVT